MTDDEARRPEVVAELLGRVQRTAQPDLVAGTIYAWPYEQRHV